MPAFTTALSAPANVSGAFNEDGSISTSCDEVPDAQAYLVHYGDANVSDPSKAVKMGYTETNSWTLAAGDVPTLAEGDTINLFIQAYPVVGVGANDIEKARYLHDGNFLGSAWSEPIILTKPTP
ncbi:fibronectin type III domain-containing protein [Enterococcus sp. DIV0240a]|uniref:fibronectin type III domain-containing protein n=1 Tax=unclassified Enterococcus TaxID=2608891 RepID=UPI003D268933